MTDETRAKFLAAIAEKVGADRIEEAHLFQPIKQGGTENGVAVVAVTATERFPAADVAADTSAETAKPVAADEEVTPPHGDPLLESREPAAESSEPEAHRRLTVYTAKYRLTLKGPERGKWEFSMQAEADAPLVTVDAVVRGVQRRSGDVEEPARLSGDEFRAVLAGATA